jgi:hypothetical protein
MLDYISPVFELFSAKNMEIIRGTRSTCVSYAPTNGCESDTMTQCNDGKSNQAICESASTDCAGGDTTQNSLCQSSEEEECSSTGSIIICKSGNISVTT